MPLYKVIGGDGKEYGPAGIEQLRQWLAEGRVTLQTPVRLDGTNVWQTLGSLPEFTTPGTAPPASVPPPVAAPALTPSSAQPTAPAYVPNYLAQAILVTLCCCWPFGILAIVFAAQVNSKLRAGDLVGAQEASRRAKMWCWISFGLGIFVWVISLLAWFLSIILQQEGCCPL
ncbi:MAG: CD225/dispanin family protein [Verrucomicrobiae bacterium]|nr:CD225/dispanin family protein [Verrucomicrobiae bacterium]